MREKSPVHDISSCFVPLVQILRALGCCPLSINTRPQKDSNGEKSATKYAMKWSPLAIFHTVLALTTYVCVSGFMVFQVFHYSYSGFNTVGREKAVSPDLVSRMYITSFYIWFCIHPILVVVRSHYLAHFLNHVKYYSREFQQTFSGRRADFIHTRTYLRKLLSLNSLAALGIVVFSLGSVRSSCLLDLQETRCQLRTKLRGWFGLFAIVFGATIGFFEDALILSLFSVVETMMRQVVHELETNGSSLTLSRITVKNWLQLGRAVRKQADLLNRFIGPEELLAILVTFNAWIMFSFMLINASYYGIQTLVVGSFFCGINLARLLFKGLAVRRITRLEEQIRYSIIRLRTDTRDSLVIECERSFLISSMACRPVQFNLCNMLTLNIGLTVWLIGGVVTYLIVLIQFQDLILSG